MDLQTIPIVIQESVYVRTLREPISINFFVVYCSNFQRNTMAQFQELNEDQWTLIQELMSWSPPKERGKPST
jgi:hypothetical protein